MPRKPAANTDAIGPVPLRTARGAGRIGRLLLDRPFDVGTLVRDRLPDDRVLEDAVLRALLAPGALLFDDAGGEDVRLAMVAIYTAVTPVTCFPRRGRPMGASARAGRGVGRSASNSSYVGHKRTAFCQALDLTARLVL